MTFDAVTITLNPAIDRTVTIAQFAAGQVNRVKDIGDVRSNPGGKGVNVASALADYGPRVAVSGFLGRENTASFEQLFERKQIADHFIRIAGQTRVGIKITDPIQQETTDINFPGPISSAEDLDAFHDRIATLDAPWFILAGSLPPGVGETIYRDLTLRLQIAGHHVLLDASGDALHQAIQARPAIIKPNIHELETLIGRPLATEADILVAAHSFLDRGIGLVVVSMGPLGACFVSAHETIIAIPPSVEVRSTVGAGDAMVAGIIAGHIAGLPLSEIARLSTAFSIVAISNLNASFAPSEIQKILPQVLIR